MTVVRDFLNPLGRDSLVRLCQHRNLRPVRSNDERRSLLAYSYHGDIPAIVKDMYRYELVATMRNLVVTVKGNDFVLHRPDQYDLEMLRELACQTINGDLGEEWQSAEDDDPEIDLIEDQDEDEDDGEGASTALNGVVTEVGHVWSRPRKITRLLRQAGLGVNQRLRTPRFRELLRELREYGIEASLGDEDAVLLPESADTPGLHAKLRLRRIGQATTTDTAQSEILSVRKKSLTTETLASRLLNGESSTDVCVISAYYDKNWITDLVASLGKKKITSIKLIFNGLGGRRLDEQRKTLCELTEELGRIAEIRLAFASGIFHTKLFISSSVAFIGSANATRAAFSANEEILSVVDKVAAQKYFNDAWNTATNVNAEELDDRSAASNLIGFFRAGSLFFKPVAQVSYTFNPYAEWWRQLTEEAQQRLSGGFQNQYAEPGQGIGSFSFARAAGLNDLGNSVEGDQHGRLSIKPYAVETTLGYWVPDFYVCEVERRVRGNGDSKRQKYKSHAQKMKKLREADISEKFSEYLSNADNFIREKGLTPPNHPNSMTPRQPVLKFFDGILRRLENDDFLDRLCNPFVRSGMPEIWDDDVTSDEFIESFLVYMSLDDTKKKHIPKQINNRLGEVDPEDSEETRKLWNDSLKKNPWKRNEWESTRYTKNDE